MCGIAGIVAPDSRAYQSNLQRMVCAIEHRGPDGDGTYFFQHCALGHRRLSIVDLVSGDQPMLNRDSSTGITFNGEIYGYQEIKKSLSDYNFRTTSDTEVVLALHERGGARFPQQLPGMFAFALWDDNRHELLCARDRFGEKPLFYSFGGNGEFIFASEIKSLLASGLIEPVLDTDALAYYMQYLYVHPSQTIYKNIYALPPAHVLRYRNNRLSIEAYWQLPETSDSMDTVEAVEEFRRLFDRAVSGQLVADVPVGAFLSGGLDSSTIVAVASHHRAKLKTFSFGFEDTINELPYARQVADLYQTEHIELIDAQADIGELLVAMQDFYDEPFADSSNIPTYLISKLARQHVKVVLTGDGSDELLGGYTFWYNSLLEAQPGNVPSPSPHQLRQIARRVARKIRSSLTQNRIRQQPASAAEHNQRCTSIAQSHSMHQQFFSDEEIYRLGLRPPAKASAIPEKYTSNTVSDALRMDVENYMPGDILVKTDRASMANGLELRAPFLDVDFASFCLSLPARLKITPAQNKIILREAFANSWPPSIRTRGKQGFGAPVDRWLKRESVKALKQRYLACPEQKIFELISFERTRAIIAADDYQTWILLVLAIWMDKHEFKLQANA